MKEHHFTRQYRYGSFHVIAISRADHECNFKTYKEG